MLYCRKKNYFNNNIQIIDVENSMLYNLVVNYEQPVPTGFLTEKPGPAPAPTPEPVLSIRSGSQSFKYLIFGSGSKPGSGRFGPVRAQCSPLYINIY